IRRSSQGRAVLRIAGWPNRFRRCGTIPGFECRESLPRNCPLRLTPNSVPAADEALNAERPHAMRARQFRKIEADPSRMTVLSASMVDQRGANLEQGCLLGSTKNTGDNTMTDRRPKIAALVADAFQEEEYFFPKIALNEAGYEVEVVSSRKEPVE